MSAGQLHLRRAGPGDAAAVRDLTRDVYAKWIAVIGREPLPMTADYEKAVREHWIDLIEDDAQLVALIEMIPHADFLLIENVAVAEAQQGRGHGKALLAHAARTAKAHAPAGVAAVHQRGIRGKSGLLCKSRFSRDRTLAPGRWRHHGAFRQACVVIGMVPVVLP